MSFVLAILLTVKSFIILVVKLHPYTKSRRGFGLIG